MKRRLSVAARLLREPHRFSFDAALRVLMRTARATDPASAVRFMADPRPHFPGMEVTEVQPASSGSRSRVRVALMGLIGATGALPRLYGEMAVTSARRGSAALGDFLDLLSHRMVASFGRAGIKYRLPLSTETAASAKPATLDPVAGVLLALTGHGTPGLVKRLASGPDPLLHYAGLFAMRPRSAERLTGLISDWLGQPIKVRQFAGGWLRLPPDQCTALPGLGLSGAWNQLGIDAAIGQQSWDAQGRIELRIGPLDRAGFEALLPNGTIHVRLVSLVRAFLELETGFAINPVLARQAAFPICLDKDKPPLLGWNTWLVAPGEPLSVDATDAMFEAR